MIGIISNELEGFSIIEQINRKYPKINIYLCKTNENLEEQIKTLKNKKCKIIILPKEDKKITEKYTEISFISIEKNIEQQFILFEEKLLCKAIDIGNTEKIEQIIKNTKISKNGKILLRNPKMVWIEDLIKKVYKNEIVNITDILLEEINKIIEEKDLNPKENGVRSILM